MFQQQDDDTGGEQDSSSSIAVEAANQPATPSNLSTIGSEAKAALRVLVLCGLPGSGKSTLAARLQRELGWMVVNQDTLGSRQACMKVTRDALKSPSGRVVIDRCNA